MLKTEVKKIIKRYAKVLKEKKIPVSSVYLFGSYAKNKANKWSDIDVAVISNRLKRNYEKNRTTIRNLSLGVDTRLEPHVFTEKDFKDDADPLAWEIRKTGEKVI